MTRRLPIFLFAAVTLLFAACGGSRAAGPTSRAGGPELSVIEAIKQRGAIRIGVKADAPPFSEKVGDAWIGFDIDVAQSVAAEFGAIEVQFIALSSRERIPKLMRDEVDLVIASMTITRTREQLVDFSIPYFEDGQMLLVPGTSTITHYTELGDRRVGALEGTTSLANLAQVAPTAKVVPLKDSDAALAALRAGTIEAFTSDGLLLVGLQLAHPGDGFRVLPDRFSSEPYGIAMRENRSDLRDLINDALMRLWESGQWHAIADTWFGPGARYHAKIDFVMPLVPR